MLELRTFRLRSASGLPLGMTWGKLGAALVSFVVVASVVAEYHRLLGLFAGVVAAALVLSLMWLVERWFPHKMFQHYAAWISQADRYAPMQDKRVTPLRMYR